MAVVADSEGVNPGGALCCRRRRSAALLDALALACTGARVSEALARPAHEHRARDRFDPGPDPEALRRALARGPRPSRAAPRPRARPCTPLDAGEGRRQAPLGPGRGRPPTGRSPGPWPTPASRVPRRARKACGMVLASRPSPPACRFRRSRPPWATPTCRPPRSTPQPRASRRGIFWLGCGIGWRIQPDPDAPRRLYYVAMTQARQTLTLARLDGFRGFHAERVDHAATVRREAAELPPCSEAVY